MSVSWRTWKLAIAHNAGCHGMGDGMDRPGVVIADERRELSRKNPLKDCVEILESAVLGKVDSSRVVQGEEIPIDLS
jgi:hypothetical protein